MRRKSFAGRFLARLRGEWRIARPSEADLLHEASRAIELSLALASPNKKSSDRRNLLTAIEVIETYQPEEGAALRRKLDSQIDHNRDRLDELAHVG